MEETVIYYVLANGGLSKTAVAGEMPVEHVLPEGATLITAAEYESRLAELEAAREAARLEQEAAERAQQRESYEALIAAGIPDAVAQRLSGYIPEPEPEPEHEPTPQGGA